MANHRNLRQWRWLAALAIAIAVIYSLLYMPTPYIVYKPGLAENVRPMVKVKDAAIETDSVIMLTTVRQMYPNWVTFAWSRFQPDWEIFKKSDIFGKGETRSDYLERQQVVMQSSQSNAIQAAYSAANIPFELVYDGVVVVQVYVGMPAEGKLHAGDRIVAIDGVAVERSQDVINKLSVKNVGEPVIVTIERNRKEQEVDLFMGDLSVLEAAEGSNRPANPRPGLGIQPADVIAVKSTEAAKQVEIRVEDIGGPSAGLVFALEIYDQLTPGDLTRGYRIAGTGAISPDGTVSRIGGEKHKIVAADREQAELFFVPQANYKEAKKKADEIGADMQIVPVHNLNDALEYLASLPLSQY